MTPEGDGYLKGVITLKGATAEDFAGDSMALIAKVHADLTIDLSEKMVQKFPNGSTAAGAAVDSGYVQRKGDRLMCKILFAKGALTINGKPQAIPGLGGPHRWKHREKRSAADGVESAPSKWHHSRTYPSS